MLKSMVVFWLTNFGLVDYRTQKKNILPLALRNSGPQNEAMGENASREITEFAAGYTSHSKEVTAVPERKNNERV